MCDVDITCKYGWLVSMWVRQWSWSQPGCAQSACSHILVVVKVITVNQITDICSKGDQLSQFGVLWDAMLSNAASPMLTWVEGLHSNHQHTAITQLVGQDPHITRKSHCCSTSTHRGVRCWTVWVLQLTFKTCLSMILVPCQIELADKLHVVTTAKSSGKAGSFIVYRKLSQQIIAPHLPQSFIMHLIMHLVDWCHAVGSSCVRLLICWRHNTGRICAADACDYFVHFTQKVHR